jgi:hypothetical protein
VKRFWISWVQDTDDHRPLTFPPNKAVLGWWCSGETASGAAIICALVVARHEAAARDAIIKDWPEALEHSDWRFFDCVGNSWELSDRFPLSDWMKERMAIHV